MIQGLSTRIKNTYVKYENHISSLGLLVGFVIDSFTLQRVDQFFANIWIGLHLGLASVCIVVIHILEKVRGADRAADVTAGKRSWFHLAVLFILQVLFGNLFSAFFLFYFRSSTLASSWPFMLLLGGLFIGNEIFKKHYSRLLFQIAVLFSSYYLFAIYIIPIILHRIGALIFILSGVVSVGLMLLFLFFLRYATNDKLKNRRKRLVLVIGGILLIVNVLYFTNIIPPIPLSLQEAGVYRNVTRNASGEYVLDGGKRSLLDILLSRTTFNHVPGEPVYVYTAVFSPTGLNTSIVHHWFRYNEAEGEWVSVSKASLPIVGGRDLGYRTYSYKTAVTPGKWRVDVETQQGQDIGRIKFVIVEAR